LDSRQPSPTEARMHKNDTVTDRAEPMGTKQAAHRFEAEDVKTPPTEKMTPDQSLLYADIRMLQERMRQSRLWSAKVVREQLQGAADAGLASGDVAKGREALSKAQQKFDDDIQTRNRMFYVAGVFLGTIAVAVITALVVFAITFLDIRTL